MSKELVEAARVGFRERHGSLLHLFVAATLALQVGCTAELGRSESGEAAARGQTELPLLRRLTRDEYDNTVADLLGVDQQPARAFAPELEDASGIPSTPGATAVDVQRYGVAAQALLVESLPKLIDDHGCAKTPDDACFKKLLSQFAPRAFRRPLNDEELAVYSKLYDGLRGSDHTAEEALALALSAILESPFFLYRTDRVAPADVSYRAYVVAARLSFALWQTMPDKELFDAAANGQLADAAGIEKQARRLLGDPRARKMVARFHEVWFERSRVDGATKSPLLFPGFDDEVREALGDELGELAAHLILDGDAKLSTLFTAPVAFVNVASAPWYGLTGIGGRDLQRVDMPSNERSGLLTAGGFLAAHANPNQSSPIKRGAFVREKLFCQQLPLPPPNLFVSPPTPDPALPTRERFRQHTEDASCSTCHRLIDPLGFAFEAYDAAGRYRTEDGNSPVDTRGSVSDTLDANGPVGGVAELGRRLAASYEVRRCVTKRWFRFTVGRLDRSTEPSLEASYERFRESDFDVKELILALVSSEAFLGSEPSGAKQ